jgi:hypothetical protein
LFDSGGDVSRVPCANLGSFASTWEVICLSLVKATGTTAKMVFFVILR